MPNIGILSGGGTAPGAPTIGTATAGDGSATVTYTAPSWVGKGSGAVTYTATSSPGGFTGTGTSPITVSGLTNGTAYTFTVTATTSYGVTGPASAASNSITPAASGSYESIQSFTLGSNTSTITFSNIPSTYKHLQIRSSTTQTGEANVRWRVGSGGSLDTGGNYYTQVIVSYQTSVNGGSMGGADTFPVVWVGGSTYPAVGIIDLWDYANTNKRKTIAVRNGHATNGTGATRLWYWNQFWNSTNAIDIIQFTAEGTSFQTGSQVALYGIKG